ncbi:MAG: response regulator transcription factor [Bacteroidota bacterium]|nr:response regulator transcription factor [Bacteroidota bacterium]
MNITISVIEDNKSFRESLVQLIRSTEGLELMAVYSNAEEAMALLQHKPDIVIIDIIMPGISGLEFIKKMKTGNETIQYLVCSGYGDDDKIFLALQCGASGFILKNSNSAEIIRAIKELYYGGAPMSPYIARRVINSFQKQNDANGDLLTDREREIIELAAQGLMYKEIASQLRITHETVKSHLKNVYQKLHVQNKIEAINKFKS